MPGDAPPQTGHREKVVPFGRIPYALVDSGLWATLKPADHAVYGVIAAHTGQDWSACPSLERIASLAGVTREAVCVAIVRLETGGIIEVEHGGGRGHTNIYRLVRNSNHRQTVSDDRNSNPPPDKQSSPTAETVIADRPNSNLPLTRTDRTELEQQQNSRCEAAAAGIAGAEPDEMLAANPAVLGALKAAGIGEPTRSALAGLPGITAELITRETANARTQAKGPGATVQNIRAALDAQQAQAEQARERAIRLAEERKQEKAAIAKTDAEWEARRQIVRRMPEPDLARLTEAVIQAAKPRRAVRWRACIREKADYRAGVLGNLGLLGMVCPDPATFTLEGGTP